MSYPSPSRAKLGFADPHRAGRACRLLLLLTVGLGTALGVAAAQLGDLDGDGQLTVLDLVRLVGHFQGEQPLPQDLVPFADLNQDGVVNEQDANLLAAVILGIDPPPVLPASHLLRTSPASGEGDVSVTRQTDFLFSLPLSASAIVGTNTLYAVFGGRRLLSRIEISADRRKMSLFYVEPLPGGARVRVVLDPTGLTDFLGRPLDLNGDGGSGEVKYSLDFETLNNNPLAGTIVAGRVFASELASSRGALHQLVNQPLAGVTVTVDGKEESMRAVTDQFGNFRLDPSPAGQFFVHIDGRTATNAVPGGGYPNGPYYPYVGKEWEGRAGEEVNIGNIYLPLVAAGTLQTISATQETVVTFPPSVLQAHPELAGVSVSVPPNALFSDSGTRGGKVGLAPVAPDRLPSALPAGLQFPLVITVQSDGSQNFDQPVPACFPNLPDPVTGQALPPGAKSALWSFNHRTGRWEIQGPMTVSADGKFVCTDPGVGIPMPGWHGAQQGCTASGGNEVAGGGPSTSQEPPSCQPANPTDPVYLFSGEFQETVTDLTIKGRGMDFVWTRKYRSKLGAQTRQGQRWESFESAFLEAQGPDLIVHDGLGRADRYGAQPDGTYSARGFFNHLVRNADGAYTLTFSDKGQWTFRALDRSAAAGKRSAIIDRNGNQMSFHYDSQGRLERITDTLNRDIAVAYNGQGLISSLTDFAGRVVRYTYYDGSEPGGGAGDLKSVTAPAVTGTPNGNDFPNGKTTTYTYSTGFADERLNHNLLTITDGRRNDTNDVTYGQGPYLINSYAATADSADPNFGRVQRQIWGGDSLDLTYLPLLPSNANGGAVMKTIVRDRNGNVKEYVFDASNRMVRSREYTGRADPSRPTTELSNRPKGKLRPADPDYFETLYEWNEDSQLKRQVQPNGNVTERVYEADLNPNAPPRTRGNLRVVRRLPGSHTPAGDQDKIEEAYAYDTDFSACCGFNFVSLRTDGRGGATRFEYDDRGNLKRITERIPLVLEEYEYNAAGQVTTRTWPDNGSGQRRRDRFTYYETGPSRGYLYQQIVDLDNLALTTTFQYDAVGNVTNVIDARGHDTQFFVNAQNQVVREVSREVTDGSGVRYQRDFYFDANNNLARIDLQNLDDQGQPGANAAFTTTLEYEILNCLIRTSQEVETGHSVVTEYTYDGNRNRTRVRYGEATAGRQSANVIRTLYDERDLVFRSIRGEGDPQQATDQYDYDGNRNLVIVRQGLEDSPRVQFFRFDGYDRAVSVTDPMGNLTRYAYDANGNAVRVTTEGELNDTPGGAGNLRLKEVAYGFDEMDRLTRTETALFDATRQAVIGSGKVVAQLFYAGRSQIVRFLDDNGHQRTVTYDTANRRSVVTDHKGNSVAYTYDANNNVVRVTETEKSGLGAPDATYATAYAYDNLDRLVRRTDQLGHIHEYRHDSRDHTVRRLDALRSTPQGPGNQVLDSYDGLGRLVKTTRLMTSDGTGAGTPAGEITLTQEWDDTSRLVARTDANGHTTRYAYDALNRRVRTSFPDGSADLTVYDVHNNPVRMTDPNGSLLAVTFDLLDRPIRKDIQPGAGVSAATTFETYAYDGLSRLVRGEDNDSVVLRAYDSLGRMLSDTVNGKTNLMAYDGVGNLLTWSYPGGRTVTYTYDELNRRKTVADAGGLLASYDFVGPVRVARRTYANTTHTLYHYDDDRRVDGITHQRGPFGAAQPFDQRTLGWDAMHNKASHAEAGPDGVTRQFGYDSAYRLVGSARAPVPETIAYVLDGAGNRLSVSGGSDAGTYGLRESAPADRPMNRYTTTPFDARAYDANGNCVVEMRGGAAGQTRLAYDYRNRLVSSSDSASGLAVTYEYDVLGRRLSKTVKGATSVKTVYSYRGWQIGEEQSEEGVTLATFVYGLRPDELLTFRRANQDYFCYADDLDSVRKVADRAGTVVESYAYGDYGAPTILDAQGAQRAESAVGNPHLFTGRRYDPETGFYEMRTRYLDPRSGRFLSRDAGGPWFDPLTLGNDYTYAANSPHTRVDPFGLAATCPTGTCPEVPRGDIAPVTGSTSGPGPEPRAPGWRGKVLVLVDRREETFIKSQQYFQTRLEALGYSIVSYNTDNGLVYDQSGQSRPVVASDYSNVQGLLVIGHGMTGQLASLSPDQILSHLERTGPVQFVGLWGCHSIEVFDERQNQFYAHLRPGGAIFGYNTYLQNGAFTKGFDGGTGGLGSFFSRTYGDPLFQYLDGSLPGDVYVLSDRWGAFWGSILGGGD